MENIVAEVLFLFFFKTLKKQDTTWEKGNVTRVIISKDTRKCCKYIENDRYFIYTGHMKEKILNKRI